MPCYDERSSPEYISREYSKKIGELTEMLCEACGRLEGEGKISTVSGQTQTWWRKHKTADEARQRKAREQNTLRKMGEKALKKLTPEDVEALQFIGRMRK